MTPPPPSLAAPRDGIRRPTFSLSSAGNPLPDELVASCTSVSVNLTSNGPASFALEVNDPFLRWIRALDGLLQEGQPIEIGGGYGGSVWPLFSGTVASVGADLEEQGGVTVRVQGFDALHEASRETDYEAFAAEESDALVVQGISSRVLRLPRTSIDLQGSRLTPRLRQNVTPLQVLDDIAREHACTYWVEDDTFFFRPEREGGVPIRLRRGADLTAFSVRLSTAGQVAEVEARAWDSSRARAIVATARATSAPGYTRALSPAGLQQAAQGSAGRSKRVLFAGIEAATQEQAQRFADAEMRRVQRHLVTADGATVGQPAIRIGTVLLVEDFARFSGEYVVESVRHTINQDGFRSAFHARLAL